MYKLQITFVGTEGYEDKYFVSEEEAHQTVRNIQSHGGYYLVVNSIESIYRLVQSMHVLKE